VSAPIPKLDFDGKFQEHIVRLLHQDHGFAESALEYLRPEAFENSMHSWVVRQMRQSLQANGTAPSALMLKQERRKAERMGVIRMEDQAAYRAFLAKKLALPVPNRTYIKRELQTFLKYQAYKQMVLDLVDKDLKLHKMEDAERRVSKVLDFDITGDYSLGTNPGETYKARIKRRLTVHEEGVTTGVSGLDQLMVSQGLVEKQLGVCLGSTGRGKCLGKGTPVLMFDGTIKPVEEVRNGDMVMGPDSAPRRVQGVTRGRSPLFRIQPVRGDAWVCNDVHVLTLVHTVTGEVIDVPLDEYMTWRKARKHLYKQFSVGVTFSHARERALEVDPYFLGLWFGDGTKVTGGNELASVEVSKPDSEVASTCRDVAKQWGLSCSTYAYGEDRRHRIVGTQGAPNPLLDTLRRLTGADGVVPPHYLTASREDRLQFLAGWLDSDGSPHYGGFDFIQKRRDWAEAVAFLARSLGLRALLRPCQKSCQTGAAGAYWRVYISGDCSVIPMRIPRKRVRPRRQKKDVLRTGFEVRSLGVGDYYGFTLDGDGRFLLGDFTVTHNTNFLINLACEAVLQGTPTLYITLELDENTILDRMDAHFTEIPLNDLKRSPGEVGAAWLKVRKRVKKNLMVKEFAPGTTTVAMLKQHIRRLERRGFYPKLIVIDYADLMKPRIEFSDSSYETQGQVYLDILSMLAELKIIGWTATQGNRGSMTKETNGEVDLSMMADSMKKAMLAFVVVGLAQNPKEQKFGKGRLVVLKNRNGPSDRVLKMTVDHSTATFRSIV
jgi:replicative DNA helicase